MKFHYSDKVVLFDDSIYKVNRFLKFKNIKTAIKVATLLGRSSITIIRNSAKGILLSEKDLEEITVFDSKDKICKYAYERHIHISKDGDILGEDFIINIVSEGIFGRSMNFAYDYHLMYGNNNIYKNGDLVTVGSNTEPYKIANPPKYCQNYMNRNERVTFRYDIFYSYYCASLDPYDFDDLGFPFRANFSSTFTKVN